MEVSVMNEFDNLQERIVKFRDDRDWKQFHNPKDLAIAITIETAELLECFRWKSKTDVEKLLNSDKSNEVKEEIADILIFLLNLSDVVGVDIIKEANKKLDSNEEKYPIEKSKGSSKKYSEF